MLLRDLTLVKLTTLVEESRLVNLPFCNALFDLIKTFSPVNLIP